MNKNLDTQGKKEGRPGGHPEKGLFLAIGMFDGVHCGHRKLIQTAVEEASAAGGQAAVLTFWPHPSVFFQAPEPTRMIYDSIRRTEILQKLGVDRVWETPFDSSLAGIAAEDFPYWLKQKHPFLKKIFVGANWRFGKGRRGDAAMIEELGPREGFAVCAMERLAHGGEPISSSRIRDLLQKGDIEAANELLGEAYQVRGIVEPGQQLGGRIGFPTLNLPWPNDLLPALGVYGVKVRRQGEDVWRNGVSNLGRRPTVTHGRPLPRLEVHLLGPEPVAAGTGDPLEVRFCFYVRPEQRFPSVDELSQQIARDKEAAEQRFA